MAGVSDRENKHIARQWIDDLEPKTVLDIGAGVGTYSIMCYQPGQHWTALEVFEPYVTMFNLHGKYDEVWIEDARKTTYKHFDLIIAGDMIEHMPKKDSQKLIKKLLKNCKNLLICFPILHHEQHAGEEGNDFETHIDHWTFEEMTDFLVEREVKESLEGWVSAYFLIKGDL